MRPTAAINEGGPWEQTELRVQPIWVGVAGGLAETIAKLASRSERLPFTVAVPDERHARILGANLYLDVDVELRLCRADGVIKSGEVLAVHVLESTDPVESWRTWFRESAGEW